MRRRAYLAGAVALAALPAAAAPVKHAPLPAVVLRAKTAYIDNRSADAKLADRAYDELSKWARLQIVDDPAKADLVLRFSTRRRVAGHTTTGSGHTRSSHLGSTDSPKVTTVDTVRTTSLSVIDGHTHHSVWSDSKQNELLPGVKDPVRSLVDELRQRINEQEAAQKAQAAA